MVVLKIHLLKRYFEIKMSHEILHNCKQMTGDAYFYWMLEIFLRCVIVYSLHSNPKYLMKICITFLKKKTTKSIFNNIYQNCFLHATVIQNPKIKTLLPFFEQLIPVLHVPQHFSCNSEAKTLSWFSISNCS